MLDLVIRNGLICDGSGMQRYPGAIGVHGGRIVSVGPDPGPGIREIDAAGDVVAPGFIDPHTHFDAQLTWDGLAQPSIEHGITTVVPGNCSLSLAPLRASHRELLAATFRQIEEMPKSAFDAGLRWEWEGFDEFVDAIRPDLGINVAPLVGHSLLRLWVLGEESRDRSSTPEEVRALQDLLRVCLDAGAIGMSTSFVDQDHEHRPVACRMGTVEELRALCAVLGERGRPLQVVPEFWEPDLLCARVDMLAELSLAYGIPVTFSPLFTSPACPELVPLVLERIEQQAARGARVIPQVQTRPIDVTFDLNEPSLVFTAMPLWYGTLLLPEAERTAALADPETRRQLVEASHTDRMPLSLDLHLEDIRLTSAEGPNADAVGQTLGALAADRGCDRAEVLIDISLEENFGARFTAARVGHFESEKIGGMLAHPLVQIGAGDGGAHVTRFATYGDTSYLLGHFVRERGALRIEEAVRKVSFEVASAWGIHDRGLLRGGQAADIVVFDPDTIDRGPEEIAHDLPGSGDTFRFVRRAIGVKHVVVNGAPTYQADKGYTDARAGCIVPGDA